MGPTRASSRWVSSGRTIGVAILKVCHCRPPRPEGGATYFGIDQVAEGRRPGDGADHQQAAWNACIAGVGDRRDWRRGVCFAGVHPEGFERQASLGSRLVPPTGALQPRGHNVVYARRFPNFFDPRRLYVVDGFKIRLQLVQAAPR